MAARARKKGDAAPDVEAFMAGEIRMRGVDELKPYPRNPKTHPPEQIEQLAAMIKEFGFDQPILVDENDMILKGHGRQIAARKCGLATVPTITRPGLTPAQKRAIVIADNQAPLLGGWDKDLLKLELGELKRLNYDLSLTGFDQASLVSYMVTQPVTAPGGFKTFDESIPTEHQCPKCSYRWSGSSAAPEPAKK